MGPLAATTPQTELDRRCRILRAHCMRLVPWTLRELSHFFGIFGAQLVPVVQIFRSAIQSLGPHLAIIQSFRRREEKPRVFFVCGVDQVALLVLLLFLEQVAVCMLDALQGLLIHIFIILITPLD